MRINRSHLLLLAYTSFVIYAIATSMLGVAWPSIRDTFSVPLDALGALLFMGMLGSLLASWLNGRLITQFGLGTELLISWLLATTGLLGYALAPSWPWLLVSGLLVGMGSGLIDAGLNTYFATQHGAQQMNWLHASFGIGATIGPLVMGRILHVGYAWQSGYWLIGTVYFLMVLVTGLTWRAWQADGEISVAEEPQQQRMHNGRTLRLPVVWMGLWVFFLYVGIEMTAGQWSYTLFTESRQVTEAAASVWVSIYWGSLTVGRMLMGVIVPRLGNGRALRISMVGVLVGCLLLWLPIQWISFLGLALIGFASAPVFPLLTADTPRRVGAAHAANAVGFQIGASSIGIALQPGIAGWLADKMGLEVISPFLALMALAMWISYMLMDSMPAQTAVLAKDESYG